MVVLVIDLKNLSIKEEEYRGENRGPRWALNLQKTYGRDSIVLSSSVCNGEEEALSSWPIVYYSEITRKVEVSMLSSSHGYSLYKLGIAALVITGRADKLKYITLSPSKREILPIENMRAESSFDFERVVVSMNEIALSTGRAADKGVFFGSLQCNGRNIAGIGLGHAFASHSLKAIVLSSFSSYTKNNDKETSKARNRFCRLIKAYGEYAVLPLSSSLGWAPVNNYSDRFDPRVANIDGRSIVERFGNYPDGCPGCFLKCMRRTKDGKSLPSWSDMLFLGPNIGFFDPDNIFQIYSAAIESGLEVPTLGAILSYIFSLKEEDRESYPPLEHTKESVIGYIKRIATGSLFPKGLSSLPEAIQGYDHRPVYFDLRGAYSQALMLSLGLDLILPASLYFPKRRVSEKCAALFALYEMIYTLALREKGYPESFIPALFWDRVPGLAFTFPAIARFYLRHFSAYGFKAKELLPLGYDIFEEMNLSWHPIPEHFISDSVSSLDASTVRLKRLQDYFDEEKLRLFIKLKSKRERSEREQGVKSANVAPRDDRGSDIEPGLR